MDKLRALQFFIAAAEERSFSGASRRLDVSVPAVSKLVAALERSLGVDLFHRTARGLTLTSHGESYLGTCQPLFDQLAAADEALAGETANVRGTLAVGTPRTLAQHCLLPALPRFHARYPDLQIEIRDVARPTDADARAVDVYVQWGWLDPPANLVRRVIGQSRFVVCASPGYWAAHGVPLQPTDLERHVCVLFRMPDGAIHDLWQFERNGQTEAVVARGWLVSSHRDVVLDAALEGQGVARLTDLTIRSHLRSGRLVPVLVEWDMRDAPPVDVLYPSNQRRVPRVRLFIELVSQLFREMEAERGERAGPHLAAQRPRWWARQGRASVAIGRQE